MLLNSNIKNGTFLLWCIAVFVQLEIGWQTFHVIALAARIKYIMFYKNTGCFKIIRLKYKCR